MKINVENLARVAGREATYEMEASPAALNLATEEAVFGKFRLKIHLRTTGKGLVGNLEARGQVRLPCSRCLEEFVLPVEVFFQQEWRKEVSGDPLRRDGHRPGEAEQSPWSEDLLPFDGLSLEIGEVLRDRILLSLPMKPLCSPDCRGLCPVCGTNLNEKTCNCRPEPVDPRLLPLQKLWKLGKD
ncbi:MAG: DUF177 domain-containing protein [Firmicutes bacterium]|nr:DUF177 domain-containing protein [Bacillota bacterium]MCL5038321.1 DUF177 domain-containing protein [Bacillota bacterium]